jgi:hypothetical protein
MDLEFLGIKEVEQKVIRSRVKNTAQAKAQQFYLKHQQIIKNIKEIVTLPEKDGELVNILSNNQFNAFTFIPFILSQKSIKRLSVTTYSINQKTIDAILELYLTKKVEKLDFFISLHFLQTRPKIAKTMIEAHDKYKEINVGFSFSHAKITIMDDYVITGSGNLTKNTRTEQYILAKSKEMAKFFHDSFFKEFELTSELRRLAENG